MRLSHRSTPVLPAIAALTTVLALAAACVSGRPTALKPAALELYTGIASALTPPIPLTVTKEGGSDHSSFRRLGFKAVGLTEEYRSGDTTPFSHRPGDTAETVDFAYLAHTTDLVIKVLTLLASSR